MNNFGHSIGQSTNNKHQTKAAYNFMNNPKVSEAGLYSSDSYRLKEYLLGLEGQTFLSVSDTSTLNYSTSKAAGSLDYLDNEHQKVYYLHSLILLDQEACPEGLLRSHFYNRPKESLHHTSRMTSTEMAKIPIEEKESYRWVADLEQLHTLFGSLTQHRFVHVVDSEGDIFELFSARRYAHIHLLANVHHDRKLLEGGRLKDSVRQTEPSGCLTMSVSSRPKNPEAGAGAQEGPAKKKKKKKKNGGGAAKVKRKIRLEIRHAPLNIQVPYGLQNHQKDKGYRPLQLYVVHAREIISKEDLEKGFEPVEWFLITSLPIQSLEQAVELIRFYAARWRVEDFHLVLKEGAKVEGFQYENPQALKNAITVHSIVALQVLRLRCLNETHAHSPMQIIGFPKDAYDCLVAFLSQVKKVKIQPAQNPTVQQFVNLIALLGSGNPKHNGVRAIWRGLRDFHLIYQTYCLLKTNTS